MATKKTTAKKTTRKKSTKKKAKKRVVVRKKKVAKKTATKPSRITRGRAADPEQSLRIPPQWPWPLRPYQQDAYDAFERGLQRQLLIWHRRAGKDVFSMSLAAHEARRRVGTYFHFLPTHAQAKRALWNGIDPHRGQRFIDIAFGDLEVGRNNTEMLIELHNGAHWQLLGSDNYNRIVGSNAVGVVFSEWALCDPRAWDFIRPIIRENGGWAVFITTYRSRNHAWQMVQNLRNNPEWFVDVRGVDQTVDINGNRILTDADIQAERDSGMSEALVQQEYYCNPQAQSDGAIYGAAVDAIRQDDQRQRAYWMPDRPVYCVWNFDLPVFAACSFIQPGTEVDRPRILCSTIYEWCSLPEAMSKAKDKPYPIQAHIIHDSQRHMVDPFFKLGMSPEVVVSRNEQAVTDLTNDWLMQALVDGKDAELMLDALAGYVRRQRFDKQAADLQFADDPVMSWHWRLAHTVETFAIADYTTADEWSSPPDYSDLDASYKLVH